MFLWCHIRSVYRLRKVYKILCFLCQEVVLHVYLQNVVNYFSYCTGDGDPMDTHFSG